MSKVKSTPSNDVQFPSSRKLKPFFPLYFIDNGIIADDVPLSEVIRSG